jgi:AI-2 transport protein TqsA
MQTDGYQSRVQTICLVVIATAIVTYFIYWLRPVLLPFVVALFVVSAVSPLLEMLEHRLRVNRLVAAAITFLTGLAVLAALGICLWISVMQMAEKGQAYRQRVGELVLKVEQWVDFGRDAMPEFASPATMPVDSSATEETGVLAIENRQAASDRAVEDFRRTLDGFLRDGLTRVSAELFSLVSTSVVILIYVFFLLLGSIDTRATASSLHEIDKQVRSYLLLKTVISIITGAAFGFTLWLFGVPMSLTFGVLAFLLNYIPNVGPIVASLLPVPFIVLYPGGSALWMIGAIVITSGIQTISGNVVEPRLMGNSSDLHPVAILLALMFWGMMWGITGMFLATPITAGLKIILDSIEPAKPVADLLAGRWGREPIGESAGPAA